MHPELQGQFYTVIIKRSRVAVNRHSRAIDEFRVIAAQKEDDSRDVLRLWPIREISVGHSPAIRFCIDDAGKDRVGTHAGAFEISCQTINHSYRGSLRCCIGTRASSVVNTKTAGNENNMPE